MSTGQFEDILSITGTGLAIFDDGKGVGVTFTAALHINGRFEGQIDFPAEFEGDFFSLQAVPLTYFDIEGAANLRDHAFPIMIRRCLLTRFEISHGATTELRGNFICQEAVFQEESLRTVPTRKLLFGFELANVSKTFRVIVGTELGELVLRHSSEMDSLEARMDSYGSPLVTSSATIEVASGGGLTLGEILQRATVTVENFLKITSLAQGKWHTWVTVSIYESSVDGGGELRYLSIRHGKLLTSSGRQLTNPAHSSRFVSAAWKGYSGRNVKKYGFDLALEWFVGANGSQLLESKFLSATTCLELLMDRYSQEAGNEFMLPGESFEHLREYLKTSLKAWDGAKGLHSDVLGSLENKLLELNRRSYSQKARMMLDFWRIKRDDLGVTFGDIVSIRNKITHTGDAKVSGSYDMLLKCYNAIMTMLARVMLAILDYDDQYFDWVKGNFVSFVDARTPVRQ
ncbi:MAG: hypothetical protein HY247_08350 [archaeon]|nr:MAG: hypothetical protein HY247_08350 [archaeon]